jgi:thiamine-phosphate pyrophosphorylase
MKSKRRLLKESRLYLIVDKKISGRRPISDIVDKIKYCGIDLIQLRDKESKKEDILKEAFILQKLLLHTKTLFIVNDYLDVAKIVGSDGLHLGQLDTSIELARGILGPDKIIGVSCHNLKQALAAQKRGADYIGLGPIFPTPTKPEIKKGIGLSLIKELRAKIKIPFFVIGNVNPNSIDKILLFGAKRLAICRAILQAKDISLAAKYFYNKLH